MRVLGLTALIRRRRKYSSYQGEVGKKAENLIQRQFEASKTMEKRYTDLPFQQAAKNWQYQHQYYHQFLEDKGTQPSMSRKGNRPDNGMMESFFEILKSEIFYGYEKTL